MRIIAPSIYLVSPFQNLKLPALTRIVAPETHREEEFVMRVRDAIIYDNYRWVEFSPWDKDTSQHGGSPATGDGGTPAVADQVQRNVHVPRVIRSTAAELL
jgi:hypothetical protein